MRAIIAATALSFVAPAWAQMAPMSAQPTCPAAPAPLPTELAGWSTKTPVKAATTSGELGLATLPLGRGNKATLTPTGSVAYSLAPDHPGAPGTFGGLFAFTVTEAGVYRVALGAGAWIDIAKDGGAIQSSAHGHGPDCTGVRKYVDFPLQPGRYVLQVSGNATAELALMVSRTKG